jgi:ribosomal protein L11 methylase PrmA
VAAGRVGGVDPGRLGFWCGGEGQGVEAAAATSSCVGWEKMVQFCFRSALDFGCGHCGAPRLVFWPGWLRP